MQTNMTYKNILESVKSLDQKRLFSNIYENIHGLASLLGINNQLVNPIKDISNKAQCKLWKDYEIYLFAHILTCYNIWFQEYADKEKTIYTETINYKNILKIMSAIKDFSAFVPTEYPDWCTDEVIQVHRSHLIQKEIKNENDLKEKLVELDKFVDSLSSIVICKIRNKAIIKIYKIHEYLYSDKCNYYRNLWPDTPTNLKMHYNWRTK